MHRAISHARTWVLVADEVKANILVADAPEGRLRAVPGTDFRIPASRAAANDTADDGVWENAQQFARRTASYLEQAAVDARFERLVLVAPRALLGDLRRALGRDAARRLIALLPNERLPSRLTHVPAAAI